LQRLFTQRGVLNLMSAQRARTTKDLIYEDLRRSIIVGRIKAGTRLKVAALAERYGSSATPVRDALQVLQHEGLVTTQRRSGYFVTHLTLKELLDLLEMREILEVAAIERAASRITDEQLEQLEYINADRTQDDDPLSRFIDVNWGVHCFIAETSGNLKLVEMLGQVHDQMARFLVLGYADQSIVGYTHQHLIQALRTRDPAIARQAMLDELKETREATVERVIQEESGYWRLGARDE
jgi:DNA-binding GntR family transcriptional regulator